MLSDLADWIDEWELVNRGAGLAEMSLKSYRREVTQFGLWMAENAPDITAIPGVTTRHIRQWAVWTVETGLSENTRLLRFIIVRAFFNYLASEPGSGIDTNPAAVLVMPKPKDPPVAIVSDDDLRALLASMSGSSYLDRRDTVIIRLLFDCGMRRAELLGINLDDLDLRQQQVLVHGKGGKVRVVPFGAKTALAIRRYLRVRERRTGAAFTTALLLSSRPDHSGDWRMGGQGVWAMILRRSEAAGIGRIYPHQLRHTWASDNKDNGMNDSDLERLAGWTTPAMSRRYGNSVADERARRAARRLARGDRV